VRAAPLDDLWSVIIVYHVVGDDGTPIAPQRDNVTPQIVVQFPGHTAAAEAFAKEQLISTICMNIQRAIENWIGENDPRISWSEWPDADRLAGKGPTWLKGRLVDITLEIGKP
jgi:hypothetical protein